MAFGMTIEVAKSNYLLSHEIIVYLYKTNNDTVHNTLIHNKWNVSNEYFKRPHIMQIDWTQEMSKLNKAEKKRLNDGFYWNNRYIIIIMYISVYGK